MKKQKRVFIPNAVLIPPEAVCKDKRGEHVDPTQCTKLFIDGNRSSANVFSKETWEAEGAPEYALDDDIFYSVRADERTYLCPSGMSLSSYRQSLPSGVETALPHIALLPDIWCVKQDETEYWDEDFRKKYNMYQICGVYLFDRNKHSFLCEITPSYELYFMGSQWRSHLADSDEYDMQVDEIDDIIRTGDAATEEFSYQHVADIERNLSTSIRRGCFPPCGKHGGYQITGIVSVTTDDAIEEIREGICNGEL